MISRALMDMDPRLKIGLTVWLGVRIWQVGVVPAAVLLMLLGGLLLVLYPGAGKSHVSLKGAALTVGLWVGITESMRIEPIEARTPPNCSENEVRLNTEDRTEFSSFSCNTLPPVTEIAPRKRYMKRKNSINTARCATRPSKARNKRSHRNKRI